jgi:hypothetical protein
MEGTTTLEREIRGRRESADPCVSDGGGDGVKAEVAAAVAAVEAFCLPAINEK